MVLVGPGYQLAQVDLGDHRDQVVQEDRLGLALLDNPSRPSVPQSLADPVLQEDQLDLDVL